MSEGTNARSGFFSEGRGRGFEIPEREAPKEHRRGVGNGDPVEIDLEDLHRPGVGPVNFDKMNGKRLPKIEIGGIAPHGVDAKSTG